MLVIAGMGDIARPAEKLSMYQSTALAATGTLHMCVWLCALCVKLVLFNDITRGHRFIYDQPLDLLYRISHKQDNTYHNH